MELAFDRHRSVLADKPDKPALNANLVRAEDAGLVRGVCRFQCDRGAFSAQAFQRRFIPVHERDHDFSVIGGVRAVHASPSTGAVA